MALSHKLVQPTGNPVVDGLIIENAWNGKVLTYSFGMSDINANNVPDFQEGDWKEFHLELLANVKSFTQLNFREVAEPGNINFKLFEGGGGYSGIPGVGVTSVDTAVGIHPDVPASAAVVRLGTFSGTWFHELGHALGLKHPHDTTTTDKLPGVVNPGDWGTGNLNSHIYTAMGYTRAFLGEDNPFTPDMDVGTPLNAQAGSFGALDIATLQHMYGARAHNTGNDTYRFGDDVDFNHGYTTIWDTGGRDTIEYVGESRSKIDLREATLKAEIGGGGWVSTSQTLTGGFTIAHGVTIENATGGRNDDILVGNDAANILSGREGNDNLSGGGGNDRLDGGAGIDIMAGGTGNDTYLVDDARDVVLEAANAGWDRVFASVDYVLQAGQSVENLQASGNGDLSLTGNEQGNQLVGNTGANLLVGRAGNDTLIGDAGDDRLNGGTGADRLTGGAGRDVFVFDAPLRQGADRITDFSVADDTIWLDTRVFTKLGGPGVLAADAFWAAAGGKAHDASDRVIYDTATGALFYDADGSGAGAAALFARLDAGLKLTADDIFAIA